MAEIRRQFIDGEYGQIHVRTATPDSPSHAPLYCLHMSPKSGRGFEAFMGAASDDRIIVAPDYPGYGESARPPADPHVTIADYARNMWRVVDALGHSTIDLFGTHTGSKVAVEMARQRPNDVRRIVMVSASILTEDERAQFDAYFSPIPLDIEGNRFRIMWERIVKHAGPGMTLEMMADSMAENLRGGEAYEWGHHAAFEYAAEFEAVLAQLPHDITILNPADDLYEHTKRAEPLLKNGRIIDCPQWGHGFLEAFAKDAIQCVKEALG